VGVGDAMIWQAVVAKRASHPERMQSKIAADLKVLPVLVSKVLRRCRKGEPAPRKHGAGSK